MSRTILVTVLACLLPWPVAHAGADAAVEATGPAPAQTVEAFVAAFNRRDMDAILELAHADIEWLSLNAAEISIESRGAAALESSLSSYFESCPSCRSTVAVAAVNGTFVSAVETAYWEASGVLRSQASLSVYEIIDGLVVRVWYFPAVRP